MGQMMIEMGFPAFFESLTIFSSSLNSFLCKKTLIKLIHVPLVFSDCMTKLFQYLLRSSILRWSKNHDINGLSLHYFL